MKEPSAYWVELSDEQSVFASVLPNDWEWGALRSPRFLLELELHERGGRRTISELHISLAHENSGLLSQAAELWDRYSNADIIAASSKLQDISKLAMVVYQTRESPLAASVAALLLILA